MTKFAIFNKATGEIEGDCAVCGIYSLSSDADLEGYPVPEGHDKYVLKGDERDKVHEVDHVRGRYKYRVKGDKSGLESA